MDVFYDMYDAFQSPPMRHAMFVHLPIVLSMLGVLFAVLSGLRPKSKGQRTLAIFIYAVFIASAYFTASAGQEAEDAIKGNLAPNVVQVLEDHARMGEQVWIFGASVLTLLVISSLPHKVLRLCGHIFSILLAGYTALWVAETADHGGKLVYEFGVNAGKQVEHVPTVALSVPVNPSPATSSSTSMPTTSPVASMSEEEARLVFFREQVRPILEENCFRCHNPVRHKGELDQTTREGLLKGGESGPAIVLGKPEESLLIKAVRHEIVDLEMPPNKPQLDTAMIETLEKWIADGAEWEAFSWEAPASEMEDARGRMTP